MFADNESQQCEIRLDYPFPSIGSLATNVTWSKSKTVAIVPVADVECKSHRYASLNHQMQWLIFISFLTVKLKLVQALFPSVKAGLLSVRRIV